MFAFTWKAIRTSRSAYLSNYFGKLAGFCSSILGKSNPLLHQVVGVILSLYRTSLVLFMVLYKHEGLCRNCQSTACRICQSRAANVATLLPHGKFLIKKFQGNAWVLHPQCICNKDLDLDKCFLRSSKPLPCI